MADYLKALESYSIPNAILNAAQCSFSSTEQNLSSLPGTPNSTSPIDSPPNSKRLKNPLLRLGPA